MFDSNKFTLIQEAESRAQAAEPKHTFVGYVDEDPGFGLLAKSSGKAASTLLKICAEHIRDRNKLPSIHETITLLNSVETDPQHRTWNEEKVKLSFTGLLRIVRTGIRRRDLPGEKVKEDLKTLQFPPFFAEEILTVIKMFQQEYREGVREISCRPLPRFVGLSWRCDVAISSSRLSKILKPSITLELRLSTGVRVKFEISQEKFHQLRFQVAKILFQMKAIDSIPMMKIMKSLEKTS